MEMVKIPTIGEVEKEFAIDGRVYVGRILILEDVDVKIFLNVYCADGVFGCTFFHIVLHEDGEAECFESHSFSFENIRLLDLVLTRLLWCSDPGFHTNLDERLDTPHPDLEKHPYVFAG